MTKPYSSHKDSAVEWLGEIPSHWLKSKLKFLGKIRYGLGQPPKELENGIPIIRATNVERGKIVTKDMVYVDPSDVPAGRDAFLKENEIIVVRSGAYTADSAIVTKEYAGAIAGYDMVITPKAINAKLLSYAFLSHYVLKNQLYLERMRAAQPHLNAEELGETIVLVPPVSEQQAIADFLACKVAQIDVLIEKKQRQIDLLQEQRTALINHAVTKGLNADAPMKDSGVGWLGEIPSHWDMVRLRHISPSISVGLVIQPTQYIDPQGTVPFLYGSNIRENSFLLDDVRKISPESSLKLNTSMLHAGDLVTVRVGYPGVTAVIPPFLEGANCASMMIVRKSDFVLSEYLCYTMNSRVGMIQIGAVQYGAAQKQFNISHAVDFIYPIPPIEEQKSIVDYLEEKSQGIYRLISIIQKQIERLQEYRTALISEAVTGKIDVREQVAKQGYRGAVLIIGSLRWDNSDREQWRTERLDLTQQVLVSAPIRYGRVSGKRRKNTYTMVFSNLCYEEGMGAALLVPFQKDIFTFEELKVEAAKLWHAERSASNEASYEISCDWGAVGLMVNPDTKFSDEIIAGWKSYYQEQNEKPQIHYAPNESPIISEDGILNFEFPKRIDNGQQAEFDFILATAIKPDPNTGIYPTAQQIAETYNRSNYTEYFVNNRKHGITTFQDEEIGKLLITKK